MAIGDQAGKQAVDELTTKTIPELMDRMDALAARLAALLARLDGATITLRLAPPKLDLTMAEAQKMSADIASATAVVLKGMDGSDGHCSGPLDALTSLAACQEPGH